jgi:asparagine synthase (glutamine-hydrolysing)
MRAMRETMVHRGPDSAGLVVLQTACLAMRRLSIIDVSSGEQPLTSEDGDVYVVCNGEIYNHLELRSRLERLGHHFQTRSDCEVIVHAYEAYGTDFVEHLNGMFALAVWDERRHRLVLARDRVGIKPLFYAAHDNLLLFASEPKALLTFPGFRRELDFVSLDQYLTYQYVPTPRSIYAGVKKLRPGHLLVVEGGRVQERAYWDLDLACTTPSTSAEDALSEQLWETLRQSVRMEMISDVPLGVFLSGGIDSSAVAAAMADVVGQVRTFSIGFEERSFDESRFARQVATYLGTSHSEMVLQPRMLWELVPDMGRFLDEPLADASIIPTYLLSRFTRQHVTVALGGDGGDELFAGYSTLQAHRLARYFRHLPRLVRDGAIGSVVRRLPVSHANLSFDFRAKRFIQGADYTPAVRHHLWLAPCTPAEKRALLQPDVLREIGACDGFDVLDEHAAHASGYDDLSQILYFDMKMYLESDILAKVDRASMATSLEVRVPLLNVEMLEFALHLPIHLKLHGLTRKYLLRKALAGRLPQAIINRPKKGFGLPVSKWLGTELRGLLMDMLSEERLRRQDIFNPTVIGGLIAEHLDRRRDNRMVLWSLLIFQLWYENYMAGSALATHRHPAATVVAPV